MVPRDAGVWIKEVVEILDSDPDKLDDKLNEYKEDDKVEKLNQLRDGECVLHMAVGNADSVQVLLKHGAQHSKQNKDGLQPIHIAAREDFVESLMTLCILGADINALTRDDKTPLQIAAERDSKGCYDVLHVLGATMPESVVDRLLKNRNMKYNYEVFQNSYKDRKIQNTVTKVKDTNETVDFKDRSNTYIGISMRNPSLSCNILVCRMVPELQSCCSRVPKVKIPEGATQISDVYQYKVDKNIKCELYVDVTNVGRVTFNNYKEIIIRQECNFNNEVDDLAPNIEYTDLQYVSNKQVAVSEFNLLARRNSPIVAFAVFVRDKVDQSVIDSNESKTLISSVEPKFQVDVSPESGFANTRVEMQVINANTSDDSDINGIQSNSDFCSVKRTEIRSTGLSSRRQSVVSDISSGSTAQKYKITVTLPKPDSKNENGAPCRVMKSSPDNTEDWDQHTDVTDSKNTVKCGNAEPGNFIVIRARKITALIKEKVRAMWEEAFGSKKKCSFFVTVKPLPNPELDSKYHFLVTVNLCLEKDYDEKIDKILDNNRRLEKDKRLVHSLPLDMEVNIKRTYQYRIEVKNGEIEGPEKVPMQYQEGTEKPKNFKVLTRDKTEVLGCILVSKSFSFSKAKKIPIKFCPSKAESIKGDKFLNDDYVEKKLVSKMGGKWFTFGICLGLPYIKLETYENVEIDEACKEVLYIWRDGQYNSEAERLNKFIVATFDAKMFELREEMLANHLLKHARKKTEIQNWVERYRGTPSDPARQIQFNFIALKSSEVSPLSDKFLLFLSEKLNDVEHDAVNMGIKEYLLTDMKILQRKSSDNYHYRCKILSLIRSDCQGHMRFLIKIMKYLKEEQKLLSIREITKRVKEWLDGPDSLKHTTSDLSKIRSIFKLK